MNGTITKITLGSPEKITPAAYAEKPLCEIGTGSEKTIKGMNYSSNYRGFHIEIPIDADTSVYGFGLQLRAFNHRGNKITVRVNADPRSASGDSHAPVPFFVTNKGWGLYVDTARNAVFQCGIQKRDAAVDPSAGRSEAGTSTDELYAARNVSDSYILIDIPYADGADIYYITGEKIVDIVSAYNMMSGGGCLPPVWGLGNHYRCFIHFDENQILDIAGRIREKKLPCDIIGIEPGWQSRSYSCSYVWSDKYPCHGQTMKKLNDMGYRVNLWEHAFVNPESPIYDKVKPYSADYLVWNGLIPDFSLKGAADIFADYHKRLCSEGISCFKLDECDSSDFTGGWSFPDITSFPSGMDGEQYHHLFGQLYAKAMLGATGDDTYSLVRNLGALSSPLPYVLYSDLYDYEDFLTGTVNAGFSGLLWSPELRHAKDKNDLIRRLQLVSVSALSLINAWYLDKMPWEELDCVDEVREILENRMRLVPYLYTAFADYKMQGKPPIRALVCDYPEAGEIRDQFLFGDMIAAPIAPGTDAREVYLPEGEWYDFFTGEKFEGRHTRSTEGIPLYVRSGSMIPVAEPYQHYSADEKIAVSVRSFGDCGKAKCRLFDGKSVAKLSEGEKKIFCDFIVE